MKKILDFVLLAALFITGCSKELSTIEQSFWSLQTVQGSMENNSQIIAYGSETAEIPENAQVIQMICEATEGTLTLTDVTNEVSYTGSYTRSSSDSQSEIYEITIEGAKGMAVVSETTYQDNSATDTLIIRLNDYTLNFFASQE